MSGRLPFDTLDTDPEATTRTRRNWDRMRGFLLTPIVNVSAAYLVTADDHTVNCTANTFTVNLPTAFGIAGRMLIVKNSGAGVITVDGHASELIDGVPTVAIAAGAVARLQATAAGGWILV